MPIATRGHRRHRGCPRPATSRTTAGDRALGPAVARRERAADRMHGLRRPAAAPSASRDRSRPSSVDGRRGRRRSACRSCRRRSVSTRLRSSATRRLLAGSSPALPEHAHRRAERDRRGERQRARAGDDQHGGGDLRRASAHRATTRPRRAPPGASAPTVNQRPKRAEKVGERSATSACANTGLFHSAASRLCDTRRRTCRPQAPRRRPGRRRCTRVAAPQRRPASARR